MYTKKRLETTFIGIKSFYISDSNVYFLFIAEDERQFAHLLNDRLARQRYEVTDQSVQIRSTYSPSDGISISSADVLTYRISLQRSCASVHCVFHAPRSTRCIPSLLLIFESPTVARNLSPFRFFCWCHDRNIRWNPRNRLYNEGWEIYNLRPVFCKHVP